MTEGESLRIFKRLQTFDDYATLNRLLKGSSGVSSEMALRLSKTLGRSAESWLTMQDNFELWQAKGRIDLDAVERIEFDTA